MNDAEKEYCKKILEEINLEILKDNPIRNFFNARAFLSYSKGKGKKRKSVRYVILLKVKSEKKWIFWDGNGNLSRGRYLFDHWATEIFGEEFCSYLKQDPGEYLKNQILDLLEKLKRF